MEQAGRPESKTLRACRLFACGRCMARRLWRAVRWTGTHGGLARGARPALRPKKRRQENRRKSARLWIVARKERKLHQNTMKIGKMQKKGLTETARNAIIPINISERYVKRLRRRREHNGTETRFDAASQFPLWTNVELPGRSGSRARCRAPMSRMVMCAKGRRSVREHSEKPGRFLFIYDRSVRCQR